MKLLQIIYKAEGLTMTKNTLVQHTTSRPLLNTTLMKSFLKVFRHYFGSFKSFFKVDDPRKLEDCLYPLESYLYLSMLIFMFRLKAVRQIDYLMNTTDAKKSFNMLFQCATFPHSTNINKISSRLNPDQMQEITTGMVRTLIRKRVLESKRLFGEYYMIAIDGTWVYKFSHRHCEHCLTKTSKKTGKTTYYHMILEAKLVTIDGLSLSILSEFVENEHENPSKQDCEIKAFHRLAKRLKQAFPKLPIILLLDGLFAEGPVFHICEKYKWESLIVLKDKDLSTVNQEFENLKTLQPEKSCSVSKDGCIQDFSWCNDIAYRDGKKRNFSLSIFDCIENMNETTTKYKSISSIRLHKNNILKLAKAARTRWVIENQGFNIQKNHGFGLKHQYSKSFNGMKIFYYLLQIAHTWEQLSRKAHCLKLLSVKTFGSVKNIYTILLEDWRIKCLNNTDIDFIKNAKIQLRLDSG